MVSQLFLDPRDPDTEGFYKPISTISQKLENLVAIPTLRTGYLVI